jgi:hypothetical protein
MLVCLFTETGIMPLRIRRFLLLLGYLQYLLSLARACLNNSIQRATAGNKSWVGDVLIAAKKMPLAPTRRQRFLRAALCALDFFALFNYVM